MTDDLSRKRMGFVDPNDGVGITDVDCTPRPRFRETAAAFEQRMQVMGVEHQQLVAKVQKLNRNAALQPAVVDANGISKYFTSCNCGWCGLRVEDPELARREYDAHPCTVGLEFTPGKTLKAAQPLPIDWAQTTKDLLERKMGGETAPVVTTTDVDGAERMFQLVELK